MREATLNFDILEKYYVVDDNRFISILAEEYEDNRLYKSFNEYISSIEYNLDSNSSE